VVSYFERHGVKNLAPRSRRVAPATLASPAATEVQLTGAGLEFIRIPYATNPLDSVRCARAPARLLAAIAKRVQAA
jgi:hypothetical protein